MEAFSHNFSNQKLSGFNDDYFSWMKIFKKSSKLAASVNWVKLKISSIETYLIIDNKLFHEKNVSFAKLFFLQISLLYNWKRRSWKKNE